MTMTQLHKWFAACLLATGLAVTGSPAAQAAGYFAQAGKIYDPYGQELQVRGISHFGFSGTILQPQYLWQMGWKEQIAQIKALGFNTVRVPYSPATLYTTTPVNQLGYLDPNKNADLIGKTPLQVLDLWMAEADRQGLYVMLDMHSVVKSRLYPTWFVDNPADFSLVWNGKAYTPDDWRRDLVFVAKRYAHLPHFFAIDLYNEPNGKVRWASGDKNMTNPAYYWKPAAESAAAAVLAANPNLLIFVQGINGNWDGIENANIAMNYGEDLQPQAYQPLAIPATKLVLSPHTYGPDVYVKSSFSAANFPANLAPQWEVLFGKLSPAHPVIIGEWGGRYGTASTKDIAWQNALVDYLISKGIRSSFYWSYTPNSGDTGGILDDALNVRQDKMLLLRRLWAAKAPTVTPPGGSSTGSTTGSTTGTTTGGGTTSASGGTVGGGSTGTVTGSVARIAPYIMGFAPASGRSGTLVLLKGRGFTGISTVKVGVARGAPFKVLNDTQVLVTIPANATTGAIGLFNAKGVSFSATSFRVIR
jgi:aryl-phospho-beta-D-glucosidase BglC (GH1 family)